MSKHDKRIERARNNPKNVSYEDFISILENEGYTIREGKGSHQRAQKQVEEHKFQVTFAKPHGNKKTVDVQAIKDFLDQLDEIIALEDSEDDD